LGPSVDAFYGVEPDMIPATGIGFGNLLYTSRGPIPHLLKQFVMSMEPPQSLKKKFHLKENPCFPKFAKGLLCFRDDELNQVRTGK
jgi:hypothetical protein